MTDIEKAVDLAVEADTNRQIAAYTEVQEITDADYPAVPYDAATWHSDVGSMITFDTKEENDKYREILKDAMWWLEYSAEAPHTPARHAGRATLAARYLMDLGELVVQAAIANGIDSKTIGERTK